MPQKKMPVIFLTFANQQEDKKLTYLTEEKERIQKALKFVHGNICEVIIEFNVTIDKILTVFQDNQNRVVLFHFAGHAGDFGLLLKNANGKSQKALADGFASFLADQKGLDLVFLNGCSTQKQADDLRSKNIPIVIGTSKPVKDKNASKLAARFYEGLGKGVSVKRAWQTAKSEISIKNKDSDKILRGFYTTFEKEENLKFAWEIKYNAQSDVLAKTWNLPTIANAPLFGLPLPRNSYFDLPDCPFPGFTPYKYEDAAIFFARDANIREIYNSIHDIYPVILLHGENFVGKTSLIKAGLIPRISSTHLVDYATVEPGENLITLLLESLKNILNKELVDSKLLLDKLGKSSVEEIEELDEDLQRLNATQPESLKPILNNTLKHLSVLKENLVNPDNLLQLWKQVEQLSVKDKSNRKILQDEFCPPLIFIDQVETVFENSSSLKSFKPLVENFFNLLQKVFCKGGYSPIGKLVLISRSKFLPEIEDALSSRKIPFSKVRLDPLSRNGIVSAIEGIRKNPYVYAHYDYEFEIRFSDFTADILTLNNEIHIDKLKKKDVDADAPFLQLMMQKYWGEIKKQNSQEFTKSMYLSIGGALWLNKYLEERIEMIAHSSRELASAEKLGLVHDFLNRLASFHEMEKEIEIKFLEQLYSHQDGIFQHLLNSLIEGKILLRNDDETKLRLINKILSPSIQYLYNLSHRLGQQAARILEKGNSLSKDEAEIVLRAKNGMRLHTQEEKMLLDEAKRKFTPHIVLNMIKKNELEDAIQTFSRFLQDLNAPEFDSLDTEMLLLLSRYMKIKNDRYKGLISMDVEPVLQISDALTQICYEFIEQNRQSIDFQEIENEIIINITKNNIERAISLMEDLILEDEVTEVRELLDNITYRHNNLLRLKRDGLVNFDEEIVTLNGIRYSLLGVLADIRMKIPKYLNARVQEVVYLSSIQKLEAVALEQIEESKLSQALFIVRKYIVENELDDYFLNRILIQTSKYLAGQKEYRQGLSTSDKFYMIDNQVRSNLLSLLDELKDKKSIILGQLKLEKGIFDKIINASNEVRNYVKDRNYDGFKRNFENLAQLIENIDSNLINTTLLYLARLNYVDNLVRLDTISEEDALLERNRLSAIGLDLLDKIEREFSTELGNESDVDLDQKLIHIFKLIEKNKIYEALLTAESSLTLNKNEINILRGFKARYKNFIRQLLRGRFSSLLEPFQLNRIKLSFSEFLSNLYSEQIPGLDSISLDEEILVSCKEYLMTDNIQGLFKRLRKSLGNKIYYRNIKLVCVISRYYAVRDDYINGLIDLNSHLKLRYQIDNAFLSILDDYK